MAVEENQWRIPLLLNCNRARPRRRPRPRRESRLSWTALLVVSFILASLTGCGDNSAFRDEARAVRISTESERIGGPDAVGWVGDFLISNSEIRVVIRDVGTSWGPGYYGGSIIDADRVRKGRETAQAMGLDQFAESFPTINLLVPHLQDELAASVEITSDGSKGKPAVVTMKGEAVPFFSLFEAEQLVSANHYTFKTDYILYPGKKYLVLSTEVEINDPPPGADTLPLPDETDPIKIFVNLLSGNEILGDIFLAGSSLDLFAPVFGFDEEGHLKDMFERGESSFITPIMADFVAGTGDRVSYGICTKEGKLSIPLLSGTVSAMVGWVNRSDHPGTVSFQRYFILGDGDVGSVVDTVHEIRGTPVGKLKGNVLVDHTLEPATHVSVLVFPDPRTSREQPVPPLSELGPPINQFLTDVGEDPVLDGSFAGTLPEGHYLLLAHTHDRADRPPTPVAIRTGKTTAQDLLLGQPGRVIFEVRDFENRLVPAKLTFWGIDPDTGEAAHVPEPQYGDGFLPEKISKIAYTHTGEGEVSLEPGLYRYAVSRGFEYSIDEGRIEVTWRSPARLYAHIAHQVDTRGWVSADLHIHSQFSSDSGISLEDRVITFAAEGLEIVNATDHDYNANYWPVMLDLGLEDLFHPIVSDELTTFEFGHFIGFPLRWEPWKPQNGAPDWIGRTATEIFDLLRRQGSLGPENTIVHVTHPRDSINGYYSQFGLDRETLEVSSNGAFMALFNPLVKARNFDVNFESLEVLNAKRLELIRTPTSSEGEAFMICKGDPEVCPPIYEAMKRTQAEQAAILDGSVPLSPDYPNILDDWFAYLNTGMRYTATAGSDSHSKVKNEAGCCRNYIRFSTDEPRGITDREVVERVRAHEVVVTYGPFVEFTADGRPIGSTLSAPDGEVELHIRIQSPDWVDLDRVELYANGVLIEEFPIPVPNPGVVCFDETVTVRPERDTWYVVITMGDDSMSPVATANEFPKMEVGNIMDLTFASLGSVFGDPEFPVHIPEPLIDVIQELLSGLMAPPPPMLFPIHPYAMTNPIWIDLDGDVDGDGDPFEAVNQRSACQMVTADPPGEEGLEEELLRVVANPAVLARLKRFFFSAHSHPPAGLGR